MRSVTASTFEGTDAIKREWKQASCRRRTPQHTTRGKDLNGRDCAGATRRRRICAPDPRRRPKQTKLRGVGATRRHRGPHPQDEALFSESVRDTLRAAVRDLSWLRGRGYAEPSAIKLVGDRYQLRARQRVAVGRSACPDDARNQRRSRRIDTELVSGQSLELDGLNVLTTIEVALAGGVLLLGRDECVRDMASFHGNYRLVHETEPGVRILLDVLSALRPSGVRIFIDRPVSNSGRLAGVIRAQAEGLGFAVEAVLSDRVDAILKSSTHIVATADSAILDACGPWLNLARLAVERHRDEIERFWLVDLS